MIDTLEQLGLSPIEAKVYETLLEVGPCFVAPLVHKTKKHRQIIYNALEELESKKYIQVSKRNGKNFYEVADPKRFINETKQKLTLAEELVKEVGQKLHSTKEAVEVFSGPLSYEQSLRDFRANAALNKDYRVVRGETKGWFEHVRNVFPEHVEGLKSLKRQGVDVKIIFFEYEEKRALDFLGPYIKNPYTAKIAPDELRLPHSVWLTGNHVYILTPASDPLVIHVNSHLLATQYKEYFANLWSKSRLLTK